jgi:signal transduction histidine kinase
LDVQSTQIDSFRQEDVQILQSLGDQVAVAIENARLYDQSQALAVVEERNRLARELHDSVTQSLYSLVLFAGASQEAWLAGDVEPIMHHVSRIEEVAQHALREMRLLIHELRPPALKQAGLLGALQQRLDMVERRVGITADLEIEGSVDLPPSTEDAVYRVAQEALNNALRHASATRVAVRIRTHIGHFALDVIDNGVGFAPSAVEHAGGMGLQGMRDRAEQMAGTLTLVSSPGQGTKISLDLPVDGKGGDRQRGEGMPDG